MEQVCEFLKNAGVYYLATVEGDKPHVRPFGTANIFENKLYIQTGKSKECAKQMKANPHIEICAFKGGKWIRIAAEAVLDERIEAQESMLSAYPSLANRYKAGDGNNEVYYLKNATATIEGFGSEKVTITF